jgi:chemotaxis protein methyltransferase CheR
MQLARSRTEPTGAAADSSLHASGRERDFELTDADFERLRQLVMQHTGISLSAAKRELVYGRLVRRLRRLGLQSFSAYVRLLEEHPDSELEEFINAVTTNLTSFFREPHHFEFLAQEALPKILKANAGTRRVRIWSSACSTGEEPYSIAIALRECQSLWSGYDLKVLATDLDSSCVAHARAGVYDAERVKALPEARVRRWFQRGAGPNAQRVRVSPELAPLISFGQLNLMNEWPMRGPFDVIFCRNVVIYFDKQVQRRLFDRMANMQRDGAFLFLGHSESLFKVTDRYELVGRTVYRRTGP